MDGTISTAFDLLDDNTRSSFLRLLMQSFNCTYVCFWSYVPTPTNCLRCQDGVYCEELNTQLPSSSSGSLAQRLFFEYKQSIFAINAENNHVPGYAFRNSLRYLEYQELELRRVASNETQRQFYQEARIKTAVFMGFKIGEIELGLSNVPTTNTKVKIQSFFQLPDQDFQGNTVSQLADLINPIPPDHQNPHYSSSSSSLRSLSTIDSPEYSSLLFNIPTTGTSSNSQAQETILSHAQDIINRPNSLQLQRPILSSPTSQLLAPHHEAMQAFSRLRNPRFPSQEIEDETITKAILAVLISSTPPDLFPSSSSSSAAYSADHHHPFVDPKPSAFKRYASVSSQLIDQLGYKKSMFKRSIQFFRRLNFVPNRQTLQITPPSSTQLHHMMSERKRREKLNENFHALRALLPPGTKKDKASLLNTTKEYLASLKSQIDELSRRNKQLEAQLSPLQVISNNNDIIRETISNNDQPCSSSTDHQQRSIDVRLRHVSEDRDEAEIVDLQVILRATIPVEDLVLRILEFLKRDENVSLMSMEANRANNLTQLSSPINHVILRLRISKGCEWDESAFQEAVRRVVADLAQ